MLSTWCYLYSFSEEQYDGWDTRAEGPIQKATPIIPDHMLQMYQPYTTPQPWPQDYQGELVSQTENERLNAWCSSEAMHVGSSTGLSSRVASATIKSMRSRGPPPQRPSSPAHVLSIKQANSWLGSNASICTSTRRLGSLPGWMEELEESRRPKSSTGIRQQR